MYFIILIVTLVALDQIFKILVRLFLTSDSYIQIIPNLIHLTYQENKGISFSMFSNLPEMLRVPLLAGISGIVILGIIVFLYLKWKELNRVDKLGFSMILAGAIGNLIDRTFRQQVTDYMLFHFFDTSFFVNNFADDLISIGFVILLYQSFFSKADNESKKEDP